jgi:hypothetical protein
MLSKILPIGLLLWAALSPVAANAQAAPVLKSVTVDLPAGDRYPVFHSRIWSNGGPTALAIAGASQTLNFQLHQALRTKTHHLAQQIGVGALLQQ